MTLRPDPLNDGYRAEDSLRYQQLKEETGFTEETERPQETYRDSLLFQRMMDDLELVELSNGAIVSRAVEKSPAGVEAMEKPSPLLQRIGALTRMGCADCLREKLAQQRPLEQIAYLIMKVRYGAAMAEMYEPSPELIADASALEKLVQEARGRSNPRYSVQRLAAA